MKNYWFLKKGRKGIGFGALIGLPCTWQGAVFWLSCLGLIVSLPRIVRFFSGDQIMVLPAFFFVIFVIWFPVTASKTLYQPEDEDSLNK